MKKLRDGRVVWKLKVGRKGEVEMKNC